MESGTEDRSRLRVHVRAAREWLGRADESLGRADDVRGDLHLMLAQAELSRARETERPGAMALWARRLAPLCAAILFASVGFRLLRAEDPPDPLPIVDRSVERAARAVLPARPVEAAPPPMEPMEAAIVPSLPTEPAPAEEEERETAAVWEPEPEPASALEEAESQLAEPPTAELRQETRLPSEDMQRLMSSAGQSLRAVY